MNKPFAIVLASFLTALSALAVPAYAQAKRPNIVVILGDDLGYADIGAFGSEINTPNIDALARDWRALHELLHPRQLLADALDAAQRRRHAPQRPRQHGRVDGAQPARRARLRGLPEQAVVTTLPQLLKDAGYHTYMVGKWHLGKAPDLIPAARGFERDFSLLDGAGSYWDMTGFTALHRRSPVFTEDGRYLSKLPPDYYATKTYTDKLIGFIDANRGDGKPFFAYVSHQAPHDPYHLPQGLAQPPCRRLRQGLGRGAPGAPEAAGRDGHHTGGHAARRTHVVRARSNIARAGQPGACSARRWSSTPAWWRTWTTTSAG
jgi:arylsulfatase A-like enzyme